MHHRDYEATTRAAADEAHARRLLRIGHQLGGAPEPQPLSRIGELLLVDGLVTEDQLEDTLWEQRQLRRHGDFTPIGELLVRRGFLTPHALAHALVQLQDERRRHGARPELLGERLVAAGVLGADQLEVALAEQIRLGVVGGALPLGSLLVRLGFITERQLQPFIGSHAPAHEPPRWFDF